MANDHGMLPKADPETLDEELEACRRSNAQEAERLRDRPHVAGDAFGSGTWFRLDLT